MSGSKDTSAAKISEAGSRWPMLLITGLLAVGAVSLLGPNDLATMKRLANRRALILANPSNPANREFEPSVVTYRRLDRQIPPDARVFFSGMIGKEKNRRLYHYFFARTYLFPREVEISLDGKAVYHTTGFEGVDCQSEDQLRTNGFDVMLHFAPDGKVVAVPLTQKGTPRE